MSSWWHARGSWAAAPAAVLVVCVAAVAVPPAAAQRVPTLPKLPDLSMTCPMHPDVVESRAGACPLCKMNLVPVRLDSAWMCPIHAVVTEASPGSCRICRRDLIQVTVALTWACRGEANGEHLEPGLCGDGSPRVPKRTLRPHGNHNPQHGGQFFMAPDNWHHLEGVYPGERVFRLYLYDDYARPLPPSRLRQVQARVVTRETFDAASRKTTEITAFPLRASRSGAHLEARVDTTSLPAVMTAKVRLKGDGPEYRFDFTFPEVTKDPAAAAAPRRAAVPSPSQRPPAAQPATASPVTAPTVPAPEPAAPTIEPDSSLVQLPVPDRAPEIVAQLKLRHEQIGALIARGDFGAVWVPAFQAKDLAVALETHLSGLAPLAHDAGAPALKSVVRTAWLLDAVGDVGNRQQIEDAYAAFTAAVTEVAAAFSEAR